MYMTETLEELNSSNSQDEKIIEKKETILKPKKVLTEKQKEAVKRNLEKGRLMRQQKIQEIQLQKQKEEEQKAKINELKKEKKTKTELKREKTLAELEKTLESEEPYDDSEEEEIIVVRKRKGKKTTEGLPKLEPVIDKELTSRKHKNSTKDEKIPKVINRIIEPNYSQYFC